MTEKLSQPKNELIIKQARPTMTVFVENLRPTNQLLHNFDVTMTIFFFPNPTNAKKNASICSSCIAVVPEVVMLDLSSVKYAYEENRPRFQVTT